MIDDIVARLDCAYGNPVGCGICTFCLAKDEIEQLRAVIENGLGFAHVAGLFNGGRSEGNLVAGFMEWVDAHKSLLRENEQLCKLGDQLAYWALSEDGAQQLISAGKAWKDYRND